MIVNVLELPEPWVITRIMTSFALHEDTVRLMDVPSLTEPKPVQVLSTPFELVVKVAVIVPEPAMVAVVLAEVELVKVIEPVLELQLEKVKPEFGVAEIDRLPAFSQTLVPEGVVEPPPVGETAKVTWYWIA